MPMVSNNQLALVQLTHSSYCFMKGAGENPDYGVGAYVKRIYQRPSFTNEVRSSSL